MLTQLDTVRNSALASKRRMAIVSVEFDVRRAMKLGPDDEIAYLPNPKGRFPILIILQNSSAPVHKLPLGNLQIESDN